MPRDRDDGGSPWEGMSGAALLRDDVVVGVIAGDPRRFGPDRLHATPAAALAASPGFCEAAPVALADVELLGLLEAPYRGRDDAGVSASPSQLMDSRAEVVVFRGREDEVAALEAWCAAPAPLGLCLVWGTGGIGKTRLAAELCHRVSAAGMVAGFYAPGADARAIAEVAPAQTTVVVIDEAHTMPGAVAEVLLAHAQRAAGGPVRVVLLARNAGDWWTNAIPDRVAQSPVASAAVQTAVTMALGPVATDPADRREAFLEAARAFRERLSPGATEPDPEVPDLSGPGFDAILFVQLAAARALEGDGAAQQRPEDLVAWALKREGRYWRSTAAAAEPPLQVDGAVLERAVAVATLAIADSRGRGGGGAERDPDLAGEDAASAPWLAGCATCTRMPRATAGSRGSCPTCSATRCWPPCWRRARRSPAGCWTNRAPSRPRASSELSIAPRAPTTGCEWLFGELLGARLRAISPAALVVAQQSGGPRNLLSGALVAGARPGAGGRDLAEIPGRTVALRSSPRSRGRDRRHASRCSAAGPGRARRARQALDRWHPPLGPRAPRGGAGRGGAGGRSAARAGERGSRRQAPPGGCAAQPFQPASGAGRPPGPVDAEEAVELFRAVQDGGPGAKLELAGTLSNLSTNLGEVGRVDEALDAVQEAIAILDPLFRSTLSELVAAALASAYTNFSNRL